MRTQTSLALLLPETQPAHITTPRPERRPHNNVSPFLLDVPEAADPHRERRLWEKRAVEARSFVHSFGWSLLDCAFEFGITKGELERGFERFGLDVDVDPSEPTKDRPCTACGRMIRANRFQRLCKSVKPGSDCGGSAPLVVEIERREAKRKQHGSDGSPGE